MWGAVLKLLLTPTAGAAIKDKTPAGSVHDLKEYSVHYDVRFCGQVLRGLQETTPLCRTPLHCIIMTNLFCLNSCKNV